MPETKYDNYDAATIERALAHGFGFNPNAIDNFFEIADKIFDLKPGQLLIKARHLRATYKKMRVSFTYGEYGQVDGILSDVFLDTKLSHEAFVVVEGQLYRIGMDTDIIVSVEPQ